MPNGGKPTKKQHYVPQVYLRGFSNDGNSIYSSYLGGNPEFNKSVPISSLCVENYLYEFRSKENDLVLTNHIEKILSKYENVFLQFRKK